MTSVLFFFFIVVVTRSYEWKIENFREEKCGKIDFVMKTKGKNTIRNIMNLNTVCGFVDYTI